LQVPFAFKFALIAIHACNIDISIAVLQMRKGRTKMTAWLLWVLRFLKRLRGPLPTVDPPNCPRCGAPMRHAGTIPRLYSVDGPMLVFRCDPCGEWKEIQGWPR